MANINFYNIDNMEFMKSKQDNFYDLAIVDPPYGIGENWKKDKHSKFYTHKSSYKNNQIPGDRYFNELFRISKNQIIWGGNYFTDFLPAVNSWIVWDKKRDYPKQHMAEGELAWTSFHIPLRIVELIWNGCVVCEPRSGIHPHEKPVKLYQWILGNYANTGDKIIDTHGGSMSIAIACDMEDFDLDICEIDKDYFEAGKKRFETYRKQLSMTFPKAGGQKINIIQTNMFNSG